MEDTQDKMQPYGKSIKYLGPSGSGQKVKVLNNVLGFANLLTAYIAIETGKKMGLEPDAMMEVLRTSSGGRAGARGQLNMHAQPPGSSGT